MVTNRNNNSNRVEFISYDGAYPNLCRGVLTLKIDGELIKFGHHYDRTHYNRDLKKWISEDEDPNNPNYDKFWSSGGEITHDGDWNNIVIHNEEWNIDVEDLDPKFWDLADELDRVINENIPYGCCGGCI